MSLPSSVAAKVPHSAICAEALALARDALPTSLFNHSLRVFLLAQWLANAENSPYARDDGLVLLFVACLCHDLGASDRFNGSQRFEVEGADAAKTLLSTSSSSAVVDNDAQLVWTAIAVHTSGGIAERIDPLSRLVRRGVLLDFSQAVRDTVPGVAALCAEIEAVLPRLDAEKALADAIVGQAGHGDAPDNLTWPSTQKHPAGSWPGMLLRAQRQNPGYGKNPAFFKTV